MIQTDGESRSSTPGTVLDSRVMYISHSSPLTPQHTTFVTSYPSVSSPVMTTLPSVYSCSKYLPNTPPEAHRYAIDNYRNTSEPDEHIRYIVDSSRLSVDPYRQLTAEEPQRMSSDLQQRLRGDEQPLESYHRPVDNLYRNNPVDLQRGTESNSQQLINAQRLMSQLQRIHTDGVRTSSSSADNLQRHNINACVSSPIASPLNYHSPINDSFRPSSDHARVQESLLRTHADPQRLVQESFREYFAASPRLAIENDNITTASDLRAHCDSLNYADDIKTDSTRYSNSFSTRRIMEPENSRISSISHHSMLTDNLRGPGTHHDVSDMRLETDQNHMIAENLRLGSLSPNIVPENLRIASDLSQNMVAENLRIEAEVSHNLIAENLRVRGSMQSILSNNLRPEASHGHILENVRMRPDVSHHMSENIIVNGESPINMIHENMRSGAGTPHPILVLDNHRLGVSVTSENSRTSNQTSRAMMHDNLRGLTVAPHNMLIENLRVGLETSNSMMRESLRIGSGTPHNLMCDTLRNEDEMPHNMICESLRLRTETPHSIMRENLRIGSETPHNIIAENLRETPEASRMVPENLCLTDPARHTMAENLHIGQNGASLSHLSNGRILSNGQTPNSPMPMMRSHYDSSPRRVMTEVSHSIRVQSPHYSENAYRSEIHSNIESSVPSTLASFLPAGSDPSPTPGPQYYAASYTSQSSQPVHNSDYGAYMDDGCDNVDMSLEEKINRGYHDIKPFDQNYPVNVPHMHMSQDSIPPSSSIPKLPKPKKPKEPKPPRLPVIHKCTECSRLFKNSTQLKNHMWRHTGEKPFACDECGSKFTQQGNLRAHRRIHTGERPYQCPDCKACFTQLSTLKTHQKIHSDERPYKCNECDAAFRQVANLKTHLVTHTGERPHKCDLCDKAFTQKSNLKAHKNRVHTGESLIVPAKRGRKKNPLAIKPFNCLECGAKFTMISNLKIHAKLHSGDKPFECDYCGAGFAQRSNLKTHIQRMHGGGPGSGRRRIRCDECPAMFRLKRCLKTHKKRRHPIKSLKIKILRESKYLMNSVPVEEEEEEEDEDEGEEEDEFDYDEESESEGEAMISPLLNKKSKSSLAHNYTKVNNHENAITNANCVDENVVRPVTEPIVWLKEPKSEPRESSKSPSISEDCKVEENANQKMSKIQAMSEDEATCGKENEPVNNSKTPVNITERPRYEGSLNIKEEEMLSLGNEVQPNDHTLLTSKSIAS